MLPEQRRPRGLPAHAARLLAADEAVRYLARPRAVRLGMLLVLGTIVLALAIFSAVVADPGFMRLASLPALPLLGAHFGHLVQSPAIFVTDRRVVSAGRGRRPLSVDMARLRAIHIQQSWLEQRLGYGYLYLLAQPVEDLGAGVFMSYELDRLPNAGGLGAAIAAAASARGIELIVRETRRTRH